MHLSTLHRNAIHGLHARDRQAAEQYLADQEARKQEWLEVVASIEAAMGLGPGAFGTTHTLDLDTMEVRVLLPTETPAGFTPAEAD